MLNADLTVIILFHWEVSNQEMSLADNWHYYTVLCIVIFIQPPVNLATRINAIVSLDVIQNVFSVAILARYSGIIPPALRKHDRLKTGHGCQ
jgi:hypothetical protein